jgi:hypothetical protein
LLLSGEFRPVKELALEGGPSFMAYINDLHNRNQSSGNNPTPSLFPRVESEQEVTYEDSKPNFGSASGSLETHSETWFRIPREEFSETHRITRAYTKLLGKLPTTSELPRRKETHVERPKTHPDIYVDYVDDLIETTLQEVQGPLSEACTCFLVEPEDDLEGEHP